MMDRFLFFTFKEKNCFLAIPGRAINTLLLEKLNFFS